MRFVSNFIHFPAMQKVWKSVKIWQSYREFKGGNFFWVTLYLCICLFGFCQISKQTSRHKNKFEQKKIEAHKVTTAKVVQGYSRSRKRMFKRKCITTIMYVRQWHLGNLCAFSCVTISQRLYRNKKVWNSWSRHYRGFNKH